MTEQGVKCEVTDSRYFDKYFRVLPKNKRFTNQEIKKIIKIIGTNNLVDSTCCHVRYVLRKEILNDKNKRFENFREHGCL